MRKLPYLALATLLLASPLAVADAVQDEVAYLASAADTVGAIALGVVPGDAVAGQVSDAVALAEQGRAITGQVAEHGASVAMGTADQAGALAGPATEDAAGAAQQVVDLASQGPQAIGSALVGLVGQGEALAEDAEGVADDQIGTAHGLAVMQGCDVGSVHDAGMLLPLPDTWVGLMALCAATEQSLPAL
ncbi:MAG: hypothetical protein LC624_04425 [Halobacteriales archaeon]|nr:hypothetical protein [Halobacteriales archaeon]